MGWRRDVKECLIRAFGSKCGICGYDRCNEALEFHHLTPEMCLWELPQGNT